MTEAMPPTLRRARSEDTPVIVRFNVEMALETEGLRLDRARVARGVEAVLADPSKGFYLLAERAGAVVGQLMVTFEWSDWRDGTFWWIQSVYVEPAHRRTGVLRALYREIEREAAASGGSCGLRLYVEKSNARAQATYRALGMHATSYEVHEKSFASEGPGAGESVR